MDSKGKLCLLIFLAALTLAEPRVSPPSKGRVRKNPIQHAEVLTRPPIKSAAGKAGKKSGGKRNKPTTPEPDDDLLTTTSSYGSYGQQGGYGNGYNTMDPFYDYGTTTGSGGMAAGGTSWEYDDDFTTTTGFGNYGNRRNYGPGPSYRVKTAPKPTAATTPEPPEAEEEMPLGNILFGGTTGVGSSGYCFCSPLRSCPTKSIRRGGSCLNFLSIFMRMRFIRCCYSPSWSKNLTL